MTQDQYNPFAPYDRVPSVSFAGAPIGGSLTMTVVELPREVQERDFQSGKVATWDNGDPKLAVVTRVELNGERRDLWATKPSAMYAAIVDALKQTPPGYLDVGGTLTITYTGDKPSTKGNPAKQYSAQYRAPNAFGNGSHTTQSWGQPQQPIEQQQQQQAPSSWQQPAQQQQQPSGVSPWGTPQADEPPF